MRSQRLQKRADNFLSINVSSVGRVVFYRANKFVDITRVTYILIIVYFLSPATFVREDRFGSTIDSFWERRFVPVFGSHCDSTRRVNSRK